MVGIIAIAPNFHRLTLRGSFPKVPRQQSFGPAELFLVGIAVIALLAGLALLAYCLACELTPEPEGKQSAYDASPLQARLSEKRSCGVYKATGTLVTSAWCEENCKVGYCPSELCQRRPAASSCDQLMLNSSLQMLDILIDRFADSGILVLLDLHCLTPATVVNGLIVRGGTDASRLFYDSQHPASAAVEAWGKLASRFTNRWNVLGIDVFNEPADGTWAEGEASDMDAFAREVAHAVHKQAPNWLVFVQGTANSPDSRMTIGGAKVRSGLGDNLMGAMTHPLQLEVRHKLVYSPHTYGPAAHAARAEFHHKRFPANMPRVWEQHWGKLAGRHSGARRFTGSPAVVLGEWGTSLSGTDAAWAEELVSYLLAKNLSSTFFWALNPAGREGSGLIVALKDQYNGTTVDRAKLALLHRLTPNPTDIREVYRAARAGSRRPLERGAPGGRQPRTVHANPSREERSLAPTAKEEEDKLCPGHPHIHLKSKVCPTAGPSRDTPTRGVRKASAVLAP